MSGFLEGVKSRISSIVKAFFSLANRYRCKGLSLKYEKALTMNENIAKFLDDYMRNPDPQYAVMLTGRWGCGKTFFVNQWLKTLEVSDEDREEVIYLKPIYVSVYGLSSLAEVKTEIDRKVNPFYYSKTAKMLKTAAKFASKIVFKTDLTVDENRDIKASASGSLDIMSLFESDSEEVKGTRFIVFDDIERTFIPMNILLGFINFFVERCKFHVLIIGDESKLKGDNLKIYSDFKEKTVGRQFEIVPDVDAALDSYIKDYWPDKFIRKEREYIIRCFRATTYNNLRLLRQCLYDFNEVLREFPEKKIRENEVIFHCLLSSFIAVYAEYNNTENHDTIANWDRVFLEYNASFKKDENNICCKLEKKYKDISEGNIYPATFYTFVNGVVNFLSKGCSIKGTIEALFPTKRINHTIQSKFDGYFYLSDDEFNKRYDEVEKDLLDGKIQDGNQLGAAISYLGYFDAMQVHRLRAETLNSIKELLDVRLSQINDMKELLKFKSSFSYGYNYVRRSADNELPTKALLEDFQNAISMRLSSLCDERQTILRNLTDENVGMLSKLEDESYPDHSRPYSLVPAFEKENAAMLFDEICRLSNKGRYEFRNFLEIHYKLRTSVDYWEQYFKPDAAVLEPLLDMLKEISSSKDGVEGLSYRDLIKTLDNVINRCYGRK